MRITRHRNMIAAIGPAYWGPARRDDPASSGGGDGSAGGGSGDPGTGADGGKPTGDDGAKKPKIDGDLDADRAARSIAAAREAEKKAKERAQAAEAAQQDTLNKVAVALGLKPDPNTDPTEAVKQAAAERDKAVAAARTQAVELAVYRSAGKAGGDPDALLDSRTFLRTLEDLDPEHKDFGSKVAEAIGVAVKDNPKLAAAAADGDGKKNAGTGPGGQGPARQGADHTGNGTGGKQRPTSLSAAIAARHNQ